MLASGLRGGCRFLLAAAAPLLLLSGCAGPVDGTAETGEVLGVGAGHEIHIAGHESVQLHGVTETCEPRRAKLERVLAPGDMVTWDATGRVWHRGMPLHELVATVECP